jgi:hypothetical protein
MVQRCVESVSGLLMWVAKCKNHTIIRTGNHVAMSTFRGKFDACLSKSE